MSILNDQPNREKTKNPFSTVFNLWPYIWPVDRPDLKIRVFYATIFLVLAKLITAIIPFFLKYTTEVLEGITIDVIWLPTMLITPVMLVIGYNTSRIVMTGLNQLRDALFARVGQYAVRQLAYRTFVHMHKLSLRFHLARRTGGLSRIIERGTKGIETIVRFTILNAFPTILEFLLYAVIFAWNFGISYITIIATTVLCYAWFTVRASNWRITIRRDMNDYDTDANSKAIDSLLNYETVKYFGNEEMEAQIFDNSIAKYEFAATRNWTSLGWLNFGQTAIFSIGMMACMVLSALAVQRNEQTLGDFVLINMFLMQLAIPLNFIGFVYREIRQGLTDIESMFQLLEVPAEVINKKSAPKLKVGKGCISFKNVNFHYETDRPILKNISFEVPAGTTLAIVGPSGSGKSTISRLLFRFYDIQSGAILIDNQDLRNVEQLSLRASIGVVPQDSVLFNDTIAYNILYGRTGATDKEIKQAAKLAQMSSFINRLPQGFETPVGERGLKLSGGEKQRIAIARTILKASPILVLDEATSALDTQTEQEIKTALDLISQNRTTIVIAHRLSTIIDSDDIIVLEQGCIVEQGTHNQLIDKKGLYATMWDRQREVSEAEERLRAAKRNDTLVG
ncbi:ABC transporter ATP-binding protein/permease [Candidatus Endowatersipora endosymbiont of Watersipora subatra]|uniref:ABCB family ABC transporter ATP-binding protein/permease n=1 Tax=Candidatus Endowatersipora endosymbiont of Watersipora subatra TaxID=3077946 RepID=UPI00312C7AC3